LPSVGFLIHRNHPISGEKEIWNDVNHGHDDRGGLHGEMDRLYRRYRMELEGMYRGNGNGKEVTPICSRKGGGK